MKKTWQNFAKESNFCICGKWIMIELFKAIREAERTHVVDDNNKDKVVALSML